MPGRIYHDAPRDIIPPDSDPSHDGKFYERWDARKGRIAAAKALPKDGPKKRTGRPRSISAEKRAEIITALQKFGNQADIARRFGIDRKTVWRILSEANIDAATLPLSRPANSQKLAMTTFVDPPLFGKICTAAKLRGRSIAAEMRAALNKLYA